MDEILRNLRPGTRVLDLGSLTGSFPLDRCPNSLVVRVDLEAPEPGGCQGFVQADALCLPFPDRSFDAVIANHSLEHVHHLSGVLAEIGRVVRAEGSLFVAVPDASTFSDRLFRWVYREDSGHVNPFVSADALTAEITNATGLGLAARRDLYSSFEYLNRYYFGARTPWRLRLIGSGSRRSVVVLSYVTRLFDRAVGTRTSAYGWALYFGNVGEEVESAAWRNVCVACGSGSPATWLVTSGLVQRHFFVLRSYLCPNCSAFTLFTPD